MATLIDGVILLTLVIQCVYWSQMGLSCMGTLVLVVPTMALTLLTLLAQMISVDEYPYTPLVHLILIYTSLCVMLEVLIHKTVHISSSTSSMRRIHAVLWCVWVLYGTALVLELGHVWTFHGLIVFSGGLELICGILCLVLIRRSRMEGVQIKTVAIQLISILLFGVATALLIYRLVLYTDGGGGGDLEFDSMEMVHNLIFHMSVGLCILNSSSPGEDYVDMQTTDELTETNVPRRSVVLATFWSMFGVSESKSLDSVALKKKTTMMDQPFYVERSIAPSLLSTVRETLKQSPLKSNLLGEPLSHHGHLFAPGTIGSLFVHLVRSGSRTAPDDMGTLCSELEEYLTMGGTNKEAVATSLRTCFQTRKDECLVVSESIDLISSLFCVSIDEKQQQQNSFEFDLGKHMEWAMYQIWYMDTFTYKLNDESVFLRLKSMLCWGFSRALGLSLVPKLTESKELLFLSDSDLHVALHKRDGLIHIPSSKAISPDAIEPNEFMSSSAFSHSVFKDLPSDSSGMPLSKQVASHETLDEALSHVRQRIFLSAATLSDCTDMIRDLVLEMCKTEDGEKWFQWALTLRHRAFSTRPIFPLVQYVMLTNSVHDSKRMASLPGCLIQNVNPDSKLNRVLQSQLSDLHMALSMSKTPPDLKFDVDEDLRSSVYHPFVLPSFHIHHDIIVRMTHLALELMVMVYVSGHKTVFHAPRAQAILTLYQRKYPAQLEEVRWAYRQLEHQLPKNVMRPHAAPIHMEHDDIETFLSHPLFALHGKNSAYESSYVACAHVCRDVMMYLKTSHGAVSPNELDRVTKASVQQRVATMAGGGTRSPRGLWLPLCFRLCTYSETNLALFPLDYILRGWPPSALVDLEQSTLRTFTVQCLCAFVWKRLQETDPIPDTKLRYIVQYLIALDYAFIKEKRTGRRICSSMRDWTGGKTEQEIIDIGTQFCKEQISLLRSGSQTPDARRPSYFHAIHQSSLYAQALANAHVPAYVFNPWAMIECPNDAKTLAAGLEGESSPSFGEFQSAPPRLDVAIPFFPQPRPWSPLRRSASAMPKRPESRIKTLVPTSLSSHNLPSPVLPHSASGRNIQLQPKQWDVDHKFDDSEQHVVQEDSESESDQDVNPWR